MIEASLTVQCENRKTGLTSLPCPHYTKCFEGSLKETKHIPKNVSHNPKDKIEGVEKFDLYENNHNDIH